MLCDALVQTRYVRHEPRPRTVGRRHTTHDWERNERMSPGKEGRQMAGAANPAQLAEGCSGANARCCRVKVVQVM